MTTTDTPQSLEVELSDAAKVLRLRVALRECVRHLLVRGVPENYYMIREAQETLEQTKIKTT